MTPKGIVREIDNLGRLVIPAELRKLYGLASGTKVEIVPMKNEICVHVYAERCEYCDEPTDNLVLGHRICPACLQKITEQSHLNK